MNTQRVSLRDHTSLHIGGEADMLVIRSEDDLLQALLYAKENNFIVHILGSGTNTIFRDSLKSILILKMEIMGKSFTETDNGVILNVNAGESWDNTVGECVERKLWRI